MKSIAFYAPMKPPNHPVPSGDRAMARALLEALELEGCPPVVLASTFQCRDGRGEAAAQEALIRQAEEEANRLIAQGGFSAWVTYHNYYKAPDLIGPKVSAALNIPYVQIESTRAPKRLSGSWALFAARAEAASDTADAIFYLTERDAVALRAAQPANQHLEHLPPFLAIEQLPASRPAPAARLLAAGMMRDGDKLASYAQIAKILPHLTAPNWQLHIAGDGPARGQVEALFAAFSDRITYLGELSTDEMAQAYEDSTLLLWPGVNEAFGMVYLEAQSRGRPVVAEDRAGPAAVLPVRARLPVGDAATQACAIDQLLSNLEAYQSACAEARSLVAQRHLLPSARKRLWSVITPLLERTQ